MVQQLSFFHMQLKTRINNEGKNKIFEKTEDWLNRHSLKSMPIHKAQ
jgi:hypothetical protein